MELGRIEHEPGEVGKALGAAQGTLENFSLMGPEGVFLLVVQPHPGDGGNQFPQVFGVGIGHEAVEEVIKGDVGRPLEKPFQSPGQEERKAGRPQPG